MKLGGFRADTQQFSRFIFSPVQVPQSLKVYSMAIQSMANINGYSVYSMAYVVFHLNFFRSFCFYCGPKVRALLWLQGTQVNIKTTPWAPRGAYQPKGSLLFSSSAQLTGGGGDVAVFGEGHKSLYRTSNECAINLLLESHWSSA